MRELVEAAKEKQGSEWNHTAEILALNATIHSGGKHYTRDDFHPMRESTSMNYETPDSLAAEYERLKAKEKKR